MSLRVWIDIDNSPHVPFFVPVINALEERGDQVFITCRHYAQTLDMLDSSGLTYNVIGKHAGASRVRKIINLVDRSRQLRRAVRSFRPQVAVSHGSRALSLCATMIGIPSVLYFDYEWTEMQIFKRTASLLVCPEALPDSALRDAGIPLQKVHRYNGFKEELYLPSFVPDPKFRESLGIDNETMLVTVRPSSMTSNYHDTRSEDILVSLLRRMGSEPGVLVLVTPRTSTDRELVQSVVQQHQISNVRISERALPGMQLLYWSDVVVSGGGTMNRESALLGTRTYSMFTGTRPAIDEYLAKQGKLRFIEHPGQVAEIQLQRNQRSSDYRYRSSTVLQRVVQLIDVGAGAD